MAQSSTKMPESQGESKMHYLHLGEQALNSCSTVYKDELLHKSHENCWLYFRELEMFAGALC
jgi:aminoglycoside N3'-acetyltransferase